MMEGMHQVLFRLVEEEDDGRYLTAIRDISPGELILTESPAVFSPGQQEETCLVCLRPTSSLCPQCWWPVCSGKCRQGSLHQAECRYLTSCLAQAPDSSLPIRHILALRCLLLKTTNPRAWQRLCRLRGHHGQQSVVKTDEDFISDLAYRDLAMFILNDCGLANIGSDELALVYTLTNTSSLHIMLEGTEFPAIFLTAALLTQSCRQNTRCVYKGRDNKLFLYAASQIRKGERLSHSRVRNVCETGTRDRRRRLLQAGIQCRCSLCQDPTENGTLISAVQCQKCEGLLLPLNSLDCKSVWKCLKCGAEFSADFIESLILSLQDDSDCKDRGLKRIESFVEKNSKILSSNHYLILAEKYKYFFSFEDMSEDTVQSKIDIGKTLLKIANLLDPGLSLLRENILMQQGTCLQIYISGLLMSILYNNNLSEEDSNISQAFSEAEFCFQEAMKCARLEEAIDGSKKTSTKKIQESLNILGEMKEHYEQNCK